MGLKIDSGGTIALKAIGGKTNFHPSLNFNGFVMLVIYQIHSAVRLLTHEINIKLVAAAVNGDNLSSND